MIALRFVGTDAYLMHDFIPGMGWKWRMKTRFLRIWYQFLNIWIDTIYVDHYVLVDYLRIGGIDGTFIEAPDPVWYPKPEDKHPHEGINVLYYDPSGRKKNKDAIRWIYGIDLIEKAIDDFPEFNWIKVDGTADMKKVWPLIDVYIRPNRTDGKSRMATEAKDRGIKTFHTRFNPMYITQLKPFLDEIAKTES